MERKQKNSRPGVLSIRTLVRQCDVRWNQIEASLVLMYTKMRDLGFRYDGENIIVSSEEAENV